MNFDLISWNIRGLGRLEKARAICNLIKERKPQILFLQETKIGNFSRSLLRRMGCDRNFEFLCAPAEGSAGGLLSVWDPNYFEKSEAIISKRFILLLGKFRGTDLECGLMNIYGPSIEAEKKDFFREILTVLRNHQVAWCLGGDFNAIIGPEEKLGLS
ncbi:hypothetical protein HRI_003404600 [Hibiscus trionum]|uniref:Endonuclease/exonuclease/phosphatase domain-containing protein n=1 Tax=Hibiscus trionum TaxID=183268 RepID=A0A9W7MDB5_HIBTR|nr:hypothetical protein HRI_003404600 [Hibiscus trionum]